MHQLVSLLWFQLKVVLRHRSGNYSWRLVLVGQLKTHRVQNLSKGLHPKRVGFFLGVDVFVYQYALVQVPVAVLQTDPDDAGVLCLSVVGQGVARRAGAQGGEGYAASVCGEGGAGEWRGHGGHGDAGRGRAGVHGVERRAGRRLGELRRATREVSHSGGRRQRTNTCAFSTYLSTFKSLF